MKFLGLVFIVILIVIAFAWGVQYVPIYAAILGIIYFAIRGIVWLIKRDNW